MNKVYKVIWSKVKNCYVVVSEFVKSHGKLSKSTVVNSNLERTVMLSLCNSAVCVPVFSTGFIAPIASNNAKLISNVKDKSFTVTVAAIVKNEAENVSKWVQSARSCADEIVVVDTGSTDDTVQRFHDYGIDCYHYDWNDNFAAAKNYMISLCHSDWIVLLDGDEWFREGCDVRKAIAKHHGNPVTKAIIADWICLDKDRDNVMMFSGGAVRAFRNSPEIRYYRKVHENLTIDYQNFVFEPDFKLYHTGYSQSVNRGKHERNLRIMRTMFDFDNGEVEYPADWRYIQDTYAGLGEYEKSLEASDKMLSYGIPDYSATSWVSRFNVLFYLDVSIDRMGDEFQKCFDSLPSVSGFRFLASIYYFRKGLYYKGYQNYLEGLRLLTGLQDRIALEHSFWRMYLPEASALMSSYYFQCGQIDDAFSICYLAEQYCGQSYWTDAICNEIYERTGHKSVQSFVSVSQFISSLLHKVPTAVVTAGFLGAFALTGFSFLDLNSAYAASCVIGGASGCASGTNAVVIGGRYGTASCTNAVIAGGCCGTASGTNSVVSGGRYNTASGERAAVYGGNNQTASGEDAVAVGGATNTASGCWALAAGGITNTVSCHYSVAVGGKCNIVSSCDSVALGGQNGRAYAHYSTIIGGGITGVSSCATTAQYSVAIGSGATTTKNYEVAIGSSTAPITFGGNITVTGTQTVTAGSTSKTWNQILAGGYTLPAATASALGGVKIGSNITNSSGTISLTKANVTAALGYTPPTTDTNTTYSNMTAATASAAGTAGLVPAPAAGKQTAFLRGDGTWVVPTDTNTTYSAATSSTLGLVKTGSNITNSSGTISLTKDNVTAALGYTPPTTDTNTTYAAMGADELTTGTATTARSVTAKVLSDYVKNKTDDKITSLTVSGKVITYTKGNGTTGTITTQDTNTTYSAATSSALGLVKTGANITNSSGTISLTKDNVTAALGYTPPTADTNTTYSAMSADELTTGTATTSRTMTAKVVSDYVKTKTNDKITGLSVNGKVITYTKGDGTTGTITTQDTNTTYSAATSSALGLVKTGSNITNSSGTISLTKDNVTAALGYTPPTADTTYSAGTADLATAGSDTVNRVWSSKVLGDYVKGKTNDKISDLSINGNVITYTKGDGTTGTITTPNTTYSAGSGLSLSGTTLSVNTNGIATSGNTGVVSGGTLYNAIKDKVQYDDDDKSSISFGGSRGTVLSNLLGTTITADSTNAVTGAQLYAVKQDIAGFATDINKHDETIRALNTSVTSALSSVAASGLLVDTMDANKADASLNNLTESGKRVLKQYAENAVQEYMSNQGLQSSVTPMIIGNNGAVNENILTVTNAGNGSLHVGEGSYVNGTSSIAIGVGNQVNANNSGAFGDPSIINADESYVLGNDDTINTGATGSFIVGNDGVSDAKGALLFGSNTKASVGAEDGMGLGNKTEVSAKNAVALGTGSIADMENSISVGNATLKRKIVNVADGLIEEGSHEVVTGNQLFETNQMVQQNTDALEKKADIDASNIDIEDWATKLGVGKVEDANSGLVTGGVVFEAIRNSNENSLIQSSGDVIMIGKNNSSSIIDVTNSDGQSRVITGVVTDASDPSSVANVGYVTQIGENIVNATNRAFQKVDNKINKAGANAAAIANLPTPTFEGEEKWAFAAGVGHYQGETAGAVGAFYKPTDNVIARVSGSFGNGDEMVGAGVAVSLNKANTPVVSKAQLVRTINAQAEKINNMEVSHKAEMASMQQVILRMQEELAELKANK